MIKCNPAMILTLDLLADIGSVSDVWLVSQFLFFI